jgi:hypothetical protein
MLDEAPPLMGCSATAAEADIKAEFAAFFKSTTGFASLHPTMMAGALVIHILLHCLASGVAPSKKTCQQQVSDFPIEVQLLACP